MHVTAAHWVYLAGVVVILATMILRKNIVVPAVAATFLTALVFSGSLLIGLSAVFNASLVAATNLFNIFLIIAIVTSMLGALRALGADRRMVTPFRGIMRNGHIAFWVLAAVTYVISLFFWPTPAVPLIGAVLIPVAIQAGLSPMGVGLVVAIAGQGMALSSDYIIRVAPGLSAKAAGANPDVVADRAMVLSLVVGITALVIAYIAQARQIRQPSQALLAHWEEGGIAPDTTAPAALGTARRVDSTAVAAARAAGSSGGVALALDVDADADADEAASSVVSGQSPRQRAGDGPGTGEGEEPENRRWGPVFAIVVPLAYLALVVYMLVSKFSDAVPDLRGGDAAALVGGIAMLVLFLAAFAKGGRGGLEASAGHVVDGLVFAFKAMGIVIPIAGFFFLGNGDFGGQIMSVSAPDKGPALLYELVVSVQDKIPQVGLISGFGVLLVGMIAGLEGSGFAGLPLTGALAGTLGPATGVEPATLAAIGQMGNIWSGGGTLVAWSSLVAVAGFARVSVVELARKCFLPVCVGLALATVVGVLLFG
jgi:hypothetical protein